MPIQEWRERALCRKYDPELFYPSSDERSPKGQTDRARAKAICRRCPVAADCLAYALETREDYGVWGGMSESDRRALRRTNWLRPMPDVLPVPTAGG